MKILIQYDDGLPFASHTIDGRDAGAWRTLFEAAQLKRTEFAGAAGDLRARELANDLVSAARAAEMDLESGPWRRKHQDSTDGMSIQTVLEQVQGERGGRTLTKRQLRVIAVLFRPVVKVVPHLFKLAGGDYGLAKTCWGFGWTLTVAVLIAAIALAEGFNAVGLAIAGCFFHLGYSIFVWIGIWNAAKLYPGRRIWILLARSSIAPLILVVVILLGSLGSL